MPEPWLRGPIPDVPALLQPVAHALTMAKEDVHSTFSGLADREIWQRPGGVTSLGFHLLHLSGATDRLFTYARGETLSETQLAAVAREKQVDVERPPLEELLATWDATFSAALLQLRTTESDTLLEARVVGRDRLPSSVLGLLFHAAEHAARHTGQVVTTGQLVGSVGGGEG